MIQPIKLIYIKYDRIYFFLNTLYLVVPEIKEESEMVSWVLPAPNI